MSFSDKYQGLALRAPPLIRASRTFSRAREKGMNPHSSNRSLMPKLAAGASAASGACFGSPESRKRLTIG